ncbi:MAG: bifunctional demethylmenaquinone methyltransferase/2-methoxy-6-polyprenyl-1,4-benzoquinol methylase UbiE [Thermoguttaceae bacterium]|jgi:demethylmenaquinone methyltransferase/2-methoxy-6-polyprenyl-1,4-benzoquinol methylase
MNHLPPTQIKQMFGEIAGWYDFLNHLLSLGIDRSWRRKTIRLVAPRDGGGPILDVCTGTADLALGYWKARRQMPGIHVVGTDFCRPMLDIGDKKRSHAGAADGLELIEADTVSLPFPDDVFQIVSVAFGLRNVNDPDKGLREMVRVCRPGGSVAVLEFSMPRMWPLKKLYNWYFHGVLPRIGQTLARNTQEAYNYLPESVGRFPQGDEFTRQMRAAGLKEVTIYPFTFGIAALYVGKK